MSGPIQFRDADLKNFTPVSAADPLPVTMSGAGTGLTDTELRATPVPVSGPVTDAQLRATPVPISLGDLGAGEYETVAASQTTQALGATGAVGDYLSHILIIPATAAAGAVSIKDGSNSAVQVFAGGGTTALPTLAPIPVALGVRSASGAWQVTTGANVSVVAIGNFT